MMFSNIVSLIFKDAKLSICMAKLSPWELLVLNTFNNQIYTVPLRESLFYYALLSLFRPSFSPQKDESYTDM